MAAVGEGEEGREGNKGCDRLATGTPRSQPVEELRLPQSAI